MDGRGRYSTIMYAAPGAQIVTIQRTLAVTKDRLAAPELEFLRGGDWREVRRAFGTHLV